MAVMGLRMAENGVKWLKLAEPWVRCVGGGRYQRTASKEAHNHYWNCPRKEGKPIRGLPRRFLKRRCLE
jgi:hypothetical protein